MLCFTEAFASISGALGQINPCNPIGATPNGSYPLGYGAQYSSTYGGPSYAFAGVYGTGVGYNNSTEARYTSNLIDENVKPDNRTSTEFGLDLRFLKNRLGIDFAYFNYIDGPQIFSKQISVASGYSNYTINATKTQKNGFELTVSGNPIKTSKGFSWDVLANLSSFKEVYKELPSGLSTIGTFYKVGSRVDEVYQQLF
jgi:outer membrane receptor protein involved in Fe transport